MLKHNTFILWVYNIESLLCAVSARRTTSHTMLFNATPQQLNTNQIYPNNPTAAFPNAQDYYRSLNDGSRLPSTTEVPMIPTVISTTCESIQNTTTTTTTASNQR